MTERPVRRCLHEGFTLKRLPPDVDPRQPDRYGVHLAHDMRLAFKRVQMRKWLRETIASRRNVIKFGTAAKS